jgi:hypothetical protein
MDRDKLISANFDAYRDLYWVKYLEPKFRQSNLDVVEINHYREAWKRHTEARDWNWWRRRCEGDSNAKLQQEIAECRAEIAVIRKETTGQETGITGTLGYLLADPKPKQSSGKGENPNARQPERSPSPQTPEPNGAIQMNEKKPLDPLRKPDAQTIRQMLDDLEAVTRSRFYADPKPIASPIEMFRMPDGKPGGESFAALSGREKLQVLGDYTGCQHYQERGVTFEQLDQVFFNVIDGEPRDRWLEGTTLARSNDPKAARTADGLDGFSQRADTYAFDRAAEQLAERWQRDGLDKAGGPWRDLPRKRQAGYLATFAAERSISFDHYLRTAEQVLGLPPSNDQQQRQLHQHFEHARDLLGRNGPDRQRRAIFHNDSSIGEHAPSPVPAKSHDAQTTIKPAMRRTLHDMLADPKPKGSDKGKNPKRPKEPERSQ